MPLTSGNARAGLVGRAIGIAYNPAVRGIAVVFMVKASIVIANFALVMLAARAFDKDSFGIFSVLYSAAGLFCIIATFGQQVATMRWWNEYTASNDPSALKGMLRFSASIVLFGSLIIAAGFMIWQAAGHPLLLATAVTLHMVVQASLQTTQHLVRTAVGVALGDGLASLSASLPPLIYLIVSLLNDTTPQLATIFILFAFGGAAAIIVHVLALRRRIGALYPDFASVVPRYEKQEWRERSFKLWISNGLESANQYLDVLIIGYLMSPAMAGAYYVTTRLANAFATASDTMHMFSTRHIPDLYYRREMKPLGKLLDSVAMITLVIIVGGLVVLLGGGKFFLSIFNEAYVPYYPALAVLCIGTAAMAAAGPSGSILMLTGHEGRYLKIIAFTVLLRAIGFFALIPYYGIMGAVTATTLSFVVMTILLRHSSETLVGLDGSIMRLIRQR